MTLFYSIAWCILTMQCFRSQGPVNEIVSAKEKRFFLLSLRGSCVMDFHCMTFFYSSLVGRNFIALLICFLSICSQEIWCFPGFRQSDQADSPYSWSRSEQGWQVSHSADAQWQHGAEGGGSALNNKVSDEEGRIFTRYKAQCSNNSNPCFQISLFICYITFLRGFSSYQLFKPLYQHAYSPHYLSYISYGTTWKNLLKHQDILSLVIISFILMSG